MSRDNGNTRRHLRQARRNFRSTMLQYTNTSEYPSSLYLPRGTDTLSQGLGLSGRHSGSASVTDSTIYVLGRSPESASESLSGELRANVNGSSSAIYLPEFAREAAKADGYTTPMNLECMNLIDSSYLREEIKAKLRIMSAVRAINYLYYLFQAGNNTISFDTCRLTLKSLLGNFPHIGYLKAYEIAPFGFWGGPPQKGRWHTGSLLTFLMDQLLHAYVCGKMELVTKFVVT